MMADTIHNQASPGNRRGLCELVRSGIEGAQGTAAMISATPWQETDRLGRDDSDIRRICHRGL
jgi:hypothetical protein